MKKTVFLSYDLNSDGDYKSLYTWLDSHEAVECGDSLAKFEYEVPETSDAMEFAVKLKQDLLNKIKLDLSKDRIYIIWDGKSAFLVGGRNKAPWAGYFVKTPDNEKI